MIDIAMISDTHLAHEDGDIDVPEARVLIHAGDCTKMGTAKELIKFNTWFSSLPHKTKILVAGNHDFLFQKDLGHALSLLDPSITYLQDSGVVVAGLTIYGSPWQPWFYNWAFNLYRGDAIREKWDLIPNGIDVLVTHGPPKGVLDKTTSGEYVGCDDLMSAISTRVSPKLHVFGHIHEAHGVVSKYGTTFVNAAIVDEHYIIKHKAEVLCI